MKPPASVAVTTVVQSPFLGGVTAWTGFPESAVADALPLAPSFAWQAAPVRPIAAMAAMEICFINSLGSLDRGNGFAIGVSERRRPAGSGNSRGKRLQAQPELRIGDFAKSLPQFVGD